MPASDGGLQVASIRHRGGGRYDPPGFGSDCAVKLVWGLPPSSAVEPCAKCRAGCKLSGMSSWTNDETFRSCWKLFTSDLAKKTACQCASAVPVFLKLLLPASPGNCYKERVRIADEGISTKIRANTAKAPTGTACPASAKIDLCTVSVLMV